MPVAVVFFPGLAFASLWHTPNQCSEGAKSLIQLELCPDELRLAGITHSHQPSLLSLGRRHSGGRLKTGRRSSDLVGYDAVISAMADDKLDNMYECQRRKWNYARQKYSG